MTTEWQDPPPRATGDSGVRKFGEFVADLRANPKRWALLPGTASNPNRASQIRTGVYAAFRPPEAFEVTYRKRDDGKYDVYVRYVGEETE